MVRLLSIVLVGLLLSGCQELGDPTFKGVPIFPDALSGVPSEQVWQTFDISVVCREATTDTKIGAAAHWDDKVWAKMWKTHSRYSRAAIKEAKRRGVNCGVDEANLLAEGLKTSRDSFICDMIREDRGEPYVKEAKRRGLSCAGGETQATAVKKSKPKDTPVASTFEEFVAWEKRAIAGNAIFQFNLGLAYHFGQGIVEVDRKKAIYWYEKAANKGVQQAQFNLGLLYYNGDQIAQDIGKAKFWLSKSQNGADEEPAKRSRKLLGMIEDILKAGRNDRDIGSMAPPKILAEVSVVEKQGVIKGSVADDIGIAEIVIDGKQITYDAVGKFEFSTFVPTNGKEIIIQVTNLNGVSNSKTVRLERSAFSTTGTITFETLNPLGRQVTKKKDALALIIGIEKYENTVDAAYADKDALMFRDYATEKLGIPSNRIKTLINDEADIRGMLLGVRKWLRRSSKPNESDVYVFYAGHGITTPEREAYLFPYDGATDVLDRTALLQKDLFSEIEKANPRNVTIFLDACYTGKARTGEVLMADAELRPIAIRPIDDGLPDNFTLLTASSGSEFSGPLKEVKQGMFSYYLMKGMEGVADTNQDNKITAGELHSYVKANVLQQSSDSQTPQLQGDANRVLVQFQ